MLASAFLSIFTNACIISKHTSLARFEYYVYSYTHFVYRRCYEKARARARQHSQCTTRGKSDDDGHTAHSSLQFWYHHGWKSSSSIVVGAKRTQKAIEPVYYCTFIIVSIYYYYFFFRCCCWSRLGYGQKESLSSGVNVCVPSLWLHVFLSWTCLELCFVLIFFSVYLLCSIAIYRDIFIKAFRLGCEHSQQ